MKLRVFFCLMSLGLGLNAAAPFISLNGFSAYAQAENSIGGFVFGLNRQAIGDVTVELVDEYYRIVARTQTTAAGRYSFSGMDAGRFTMRVSMSGTPFEDGEATVEIQNFTHEDSSGRTRVTGQVHEQIDIYLKVRKGVTPANAVVFAQDVPAEARKLCEKAIDDLDNKRTQEGLNGLKAALEIFPKYHAALERLGFEYVKLGRPETFRAAVVLFTNAVEVYPQGFKSWYFLAYSQYSLGAFAEAITAVQKAIELNGGSSDAVFLLGVLMKNTRKYDEAEKQLLKARDLAKDSNPKIHWELATLYGNILDRYADAARELKLFLKGQHDSKDAEKIKKLIADFEAKAAATK